MTGLVALGGLIVGGGLPGWAIVRWVFNFIEKRRDDGFDEVARRGEGGVVDRSLPPGEHRPPSNLRSLQ